MYIRRLALSLLVLLFPVSASAAALYLDPPSGTYGPGDTFILNIRMDTGGECINAADVMLSFPKGVLRAVDFGKGGSIFSLWAVEPVLDNKNGTVHFAGGIPGGYCGRISGDPRLTNNIGKLVFTVTDPSAGKAVIRFSKVSALYLNDGNGTALKPELQSAAMTLVSERQNLSNPWVSEVKGDSIPPEPFATMIESSGTVFGGNYFAVFSTVDKQSGIDHYEMLIKGEWQTVTSPHEVDDEMLKSSVQIRAMDKAGNVRVGTYDPSQIPARQTPVGDYLALVGIILLLVLALVVRHYLNKKNSEVNPTIDLRT